MAELASQQQLLLMHSCETTSRSCNSNDGGVHLERQCKRTAELALQQHQQLTHSRSCNSNDGRVHLEQR
jgi:hypothetical protein